MDALRGVDLELYEGELVVLVGPSGSDKSTLLNILGGLDVPTNGRVYFRDTERTALDQRALTAYRREHVGFVFRFYNPIPSLTARENVALVSPGSPSGGAGRIPRSALGAVPRGRRLGCVCA